MLCQLLTLYKGPRQAEDTDTSAHPLAIHLSSLLLTPCVAATTATPVAMAVDTAMAVDLAPTMAVVMAPDMAVVMELDTAVAMEPAMAVAMEPATAVATEPAVAMALAVATGATGHCATEDATLLAARTSRPSLVCF